MSTSVVDDGEIEGGVGGLTSGFDGGDETGTEGVSEQELEADERVPIGMTAKRNEGLTDGPTGAEGVESISVSKLVRRESVCTETDGQDR